MNAKELSQAKKEFKQIRGQRFLSVSKDPLELFNFILQCNRYVNLMSKEDQQTVYNGRQIQKQRIFFTAITSFCSVYPLSKIFNFFKLHSPLKNFAITNFFTRYIGFPLICVLYCKMFLCNDIYAIQDDIIQKYKFGFQDYLKIQKLYERAYGAHAVNQMLQTKNFDWSLIPEIQ